MKRFLISMAGLSVLLACVPLEGRERFNQASFDRLTEEVDRLNALDPEEARPLVKRLNFFVESNASFENRIRLAVAKAPLEVIDHGYRSAIHSLIAYLGEAQAAEGAANLYPLLRCAIAELALRQGEYRYAFSQILEGLDALGPETSETVRSRIYETVIVLNLEAGFPEFASVNLDHWRHTGNPDPLQERLLEAEIAWFQWDFQTAERNLDELSSLFETSTKAEPVLEFWMERVWLCLAEGVFMQAEEYLAKARSLLEQIPSIPVEAQVEFLEGLLMLQAGAADPELCREKLREAHEHLLSMGWPSQYAAWLRRAAFLYDSVRSDDLPVPLLEELARFAHENKNLKAVAAGFSAWGDLTLLNGAANPSLALDRYHRGMRFANQFAREMNALQAEWFLARPALSLPHAFRSESALFFYALVLLLVLLASLLVLVLHVRSQRHLNRQLEDAVQKARIAEEAAEQSSELKTRFLANVSHELKTPMSGLVGMASLLDEMVTDPQQRKYLSTIRTCSQNLLVLVNDLLDLGRIESGNLEIERSPFDIRQSVDYCLELVRDRAAAKGLELHSSVSASIPRKLVGDSTRICQILTNLLTNAIKFTDEGRIDLQVDFESTLGDSGNLLLSVEDTGIGIAPGKIHTIFEPFSQERAGDSPKHEGSGLGLAICRKLIELMGGTITVHSKPGEGSTFMISIPLQSDSEEP